MQQNWTPAFATSELPTPGAKRFRPRPGQRIAVVRLADGEIYAVDDACPHEGYPLSQGQLDGCVLTCIWHNFKFDVRDGQCIKGEEAVRTYPVRVHDGMVELDLTEADVSDRITKTYDSLEHGILQQRLGSASRDVVRLLLDGESPEALLGHAASLDARYAQWGPSHALPVAADALALLPYLPGLQATAAIMQPLELVGLHTRRPLRQRAELPQSSGDGLTQLRLAVEAEDGLMAEALVRAAVREGVPLATLQSWLLQLCADHFLAFGHRLIQTIKAFDLLERTGPSFAEDILGALAFGISHGTREEQVPEWLHWRRQVEALDVTALWRAQQGSTRGPLPTTVLEAVLDGGRGAAIDAVAEALGSGVALESVVDALSVAAAHRMLRFEVRHDGDPTVQNGWLDVTHPMTFANATRHAVRRLDSPDAVRLVLQATEFIHRHRPLDGPVHATSTGVVHADPEAVLAAIVAKDAPLALGAAAACLGRDEPRQALRDTMTTLVLQDITPVPIAAAHVLKVAVAAWDEWDALPAGPHRSAPVLAAVRLAASPLQQRWLARRVHEAIRFVAEGSVPRLLA